MAIRKIKDAKDLDTNELIYFKGHAQATFMSDGRTVEEAINSSMGGSDIYADLDITKERFAELLNRDFYCPVLQSEPTSSTLTYTDTDGSINHFVIGQECRVPDIESQDYSVYKFMGTYQNSAVWQKLPGKLSDLENDMSLYSGANVQVVDEDGELDEPNVTYLTTAQQILSDEEKETVKANLGIVEQEVDLTLYATKEELPSKVLDLVNDAGYIQTTDSDSEVLDPDVMYSAKDLSMYDIHGESIKQTTANCYVVNKKGMYKFPIAYGAAIKNGVVNAAAYTKVAGDYSMDFVNYKDQVITSPYIETDTNTMADSLEISMADTEGIFETLGIVSEDDCRYVLFQVNEVPATGANAVISVLDMEGIVMWSWHIWVWADDLTPIEITNNTGVKYNILPVNLATKKSTTEGKMYNWFYQWGRPTPMLPPSEYNSTTIADNYGVRTFAASFGKADTYGVGIQNPQMFYKNGSSYNWFGTASYYNLWDANCVSTGNSDNDVVKTVYDPCPPGFKMPNGNTFTYFSLTNVVGSFNNGWYFKRNSEDTTGVFFPASGKRDYAIDLIGDVGRGGCVWLSSANSQRFVYSLVFSASAMYSQGNTYRPGGFSVRPVQE